MPWEQFRSGFLCLSAPPLPPPPELTRNSVEAGSSVPERSFLCVCEAITKDSQEKQGLFLFTLFKNFF